MKATFKTQRGYSLIELSIALAILGLVIAGSVAGVQAILRANSVNNTIAETNETVGRIVAKFSREADYANVTNASAIQAGMNIFRDNRRNATNGINAFGRNALLAPVPAAGLQGLGQNQGFVLTNNVPTAACVDLVMGLDPLAYAIQVSAATQNAAVTVFGANAADGLVKAPNGVLRATDVATACGAGPDSAVTILIPRS